MAAVVLGPAPAPTEGHELESDEAPGVEVPAGAAQELGLEAALLLRGIVASNPGRPPVYAKAFSTSFS